MCMLWTCPSINTTIINKNKNLKGKKKELNCNPLHHVIVPDFLACVYTCIFLCVCTCVSWRGGHVNAGAHVIRSQGLTWVSSLIPLHLTCIETRPLTYTQSLLIQLVQLASLPERSLGLPGILVELNPGPHIRSASPPPLNHLSVPAFPLSMALIPVPSHMLCLHSVLCLQWILYIRKQPQRQGLYLFYLVM